MSVAYNPSPMATLRPFRALRPRASDAGRIAAVPYDVVSTDEARALAGDNPLSFLRVSRAEIELPPGADPYSDAVYRRAADNFDALKKDALVIAFGRIPALYIADGHHRAASAARARADIRDRAITRSSLGDGADYTTMLAVAFPHDQVQILPYNRTVKDLGGSTPDAFLDAVRDRFEVEAGPSTPARRGTMAMYFRGGWHTLWPRARPDESDAITSLDVSVLQNQLL